MPAVEDQPQRRVRLNRQILAPLDSYVRLFLLLGFCIAWPPHFCNIAFRSKILQNSNIKRKNMLGNIWGKEREGR